MQKFFAVMILWLAAWGVSTGPGLAQQRVWVQVEAVPTLAEGEARARAYAARLEAVNGFRMGSGWYAIALGPFSPGDANRELARLRAGGLVPGDSFIAYTRSFRQQFWPVGADALAAAPIALPETDDDVTEVAVAPPPPPPPPADETRAEARASERSLDRDARMALQVALQWEGFYKSGIDGAFGPGTRRAMSEYQEATGQEATGILTTKQRAEILASYQGAIDSLGLAQIRDDQAGIEMVMPATLVHFARYEAPFAHYESSGDSGVRVVLISQTGDQNTLFGLYDILQTLEIVPLEGPRERKRSEFTIEGDAPDFTSYTYATLSGGAVKGFTLVWPRDIDPRLRNLALKQMRASFTALDGTALADNAGLDAAVQSLDLLSGLEIRRADRARSGFYVDQGGAVLTTADAVQGCTRITIDDSFDAKVIALDDARGLAVIRPDDPLAPTGVARILTTEPRLKSDIAVAGYTFGGRLSAPTLTFGTLADLKGLAGEADLTRLALEVQDGDAGGPVMDVGGTVLGMLLPRSEGGARQLPGDVNFAANAGTLAAFLTENGIEPQAADAGGAMNPVDMTAMAADMTVLVSCWK